MKQFVLLLALALLPTLPAKSGDWKIADLPKYAEDVTFVAIGSDGLLYAARSNPNGYVFESLSDLYRFSPSGDGFSGKVMARKPLYYLGAGCDAAGEGLTGEWTKSGNGLDFAISKGSDAVISFRLLSTGLSPSHAC